MRVVTVVGTRPEIIRLSRVIPRLDTMFDHTLVHTGQNWDYRLNELFFRDLELRPPDHVLQVDTSSLGSVLGDTLKKIEPVLSELRPDAFLVLGDTNSAISAVIAKRLKIPVYHMEAGNRCFDENVPEETNRRLVDHVADFNLAYTEHARRNLLAEGLHPRRIMVTGSPMHEVLLHYRSAIESSDVLTQFGLDAGGFFLVSAHREETVDQPDRLRSLIRILTAVQEQWRLPLVVSTHPRTRKRLDALNGDLGMPGVSFHEPYSFTEYNKLQMHARCVLSDSGTISEESAMLRFPAITLRSSIERPEALDSGSIVMTDLCPDRVLAAITSVTESTVEHSLPVEYLVPDCSTRVCNFILSTAGEHARWAALR